MPKLNRPKLTPPLKCHLISAIQAEKIIDLMPPRCRTPNAPKSDDDGWMHYVEPYAGGLAVLLANDPEGISEVANDMNLELTRFWQVMQCPSHFEEFRRTIENTPFSDWEFSNSVKDHRTESSVDPIDMAVNFFIRCRQSLSGRMKGFAGITRNRTRRGMNEQVSAWLNAVEGLPAVHARLKRVLILNKPALDVIRSEDGHRTLFYLDPPYLHETRASTGEYEHEMTVEQHEELLSSLVKIKGQFLLSGYRSPLYDQFTCKYDWKRYDNKAAGGKTKRIMTECIWANF